MNKLLIRFFFPASKISFLKPQIHPSIKGNIKSAKLTQFVGNDNTSSPVISNGVKISDNFILIHHSKADYILN